MCDVLCKEMKISRRTFFRDLDALRQAGIPIVYDSKNREYALERHFVFDWVSNGALTWRDAVALLAILSIVQCPHDSELEQYKAELTGKLLNWIRNNHGDEADSIIANSKLLKSNPSASVKGMHGLVLSAQGRLQSARERESMAV
jgi:predicted DNA-binding transcriptional regulator YafY